MAKKSNINWLKIFSLTELAYLAVGIVLFVFGLKGFMLPNSFIDGGATGIALLSHELFHIPLELPLAAINIIFIWLGYKKIGKVFAVKSFIAILLLTLFFTFSDFSPVTSDKLLIALFGGLIIGAGMGLVIRSGAVLDGFEVLAVLTTKKTGFSVSEIIMLFNSIIFLTAAMKFGIETAMYAIITYFAATRTSDYVVDGIEEYTALTIISAKFNEIKSVIVNDFHKGITVYKGERGYLPNSYHSHTNCDIIVTIVTRLEIVRIKEAISNCDPNAFMFLQSINETKGGILKHKAGH